MYSLIPSVIDMYDGCPIWNQLSLKFWKKKLPLNGILPNNCNGGGFITDIYGMSNLHKLYWLLALARIFQDTIKGECRFKERTTD